MEDIRRSIRIRRLDSMIQDLDEKMDHINEARRRMLSVPSRGFLKAQREYLVTEVDAILKVREEMVEQLTGTAKLEFQERSRSYSELRSNIASGQAIKSRLLTLCADFLNDVEQDLKLQKTKIEEEKKSIGSIFQRRYYGFLFRLMFYMIFNQMLNLLRTKFNV